MTLVHSSFPSVVEHAVTQFYQRPDQQGPERYAHHAQPNVRELLQAGTQCQAEAQFQQQRCEVPHGARQVLMSVSRVQRLFTATSHPCDQHEDENRVKGPNGKEYEEPVPGDIGVQLENQHDEENKGEKPSQEHPLDQGHFHLRRAVCVQ